MRYTVLSALLGLALAACALPPAGVREQGTLFVYGASLAPDKAARCIVRNTPKRFPGLVATERRALDAEAWDVTVADASGVLATARMDVSLILVRVHAPGPDNESFAHGLIHSC